MSLLCRCIDGVQVSMGIGLVFLLIVGFIILILGINYLFKNYKIVKKKK